MRNSGVIKIVFAALGASLIAICSWITVPGPVPFTLQSFAVFFVLFLLGGRLGTYSVLAYILLGAVGVPVFSGFKGGVGALFGPTGGYILGFLLSALIFWLFSYLGGNSAKLGLLSAFVGLIIWYISGTAWFILIMSKNDSGMTVLKALSLCVFPFIAFDVLKILLARVLSARISKAIKWKG